jgi:polysaccharide export outer membrane protein
MPFIHGGTLLFRSIICLLFAVVLAGCSATGQPQSESAALASYARTVPIRGSDGPYHLGPGDRIHIRAYDDTNLTGDYEVNSAGYVSVPLIGQIKAAGLTTRQLEQSIIGRMKGRIAQDPKINVEISTYASFYIFGEVKKAGVYPFQPGLTVADAVATAGGLTYRANEDSIVVQHAGSKTQQVVPLSVPVKIYPGDNIRVGERIF